MTQTTSVNANNSLSLVRDGGSAWPSGAFTVTYRAKVAAWSGADWQTILGFRLSDSSSGHEFLVAAKLSTSDIRVYAENFADGLGMYGQRSFSTGATTDWLDIVASWDGSSAECDVSVAINGGAPVTHQVLAAKLYSIHVFTDVYAEQADQIRGCGLFVYDGLLSAPKIAEQLASDVPIASTGGPTLWNWLALDSDVSPGTDASGNSRNFTPTGTGATVADAPYSAPAISGESAHTQADDTSSATGSVRVNGAAAHTLAGDSSAATGSVRVTGSAGLSQGGDSAVANGTVLVSGASAATQGDDTVSASGAATSIISGVSNHTQSGDSVTASGSVRVTGSSSHTQAGDVVVARDVEESAAPTVISASLRSAVNPIATTALLRSRSNPITVTAQLRSAA